MFALLHSLAIFVIDFFKSPRRLEVENLFLRHQLSIALRRAPPRLRLRGSDGEGPRFFFFFDWTCAATGLAHAADLSLSPRASLGAGRFVLPACLPFQNTR